jgi:serpin B
MNNPIATGNGQNRSKPDIHESTFPHHGGKCLKQTLLILLSFIALSMQMAAPAQVESLVASNTAFALNLYGQLAANSGNLFFSPYSISTCLAMTYAGARGDTEQQMAQVLGFDIDQQQFASLFGQLQAQLEASQETNAVDLHIANALWTQEGYPFLPAFLETATNQYQASVNEADFTTQADAVTETINHWVAQETQNRIQSILPPGSIGPDTVVVLADAIYFLGVWTVSFEETNTSTQPFYLSSTSLVDAPLMHQPKVGANYMETSDLQAVELPYGTNQLASMVILLPRQVEGWAQLEEQLSPAFLSATLAAMRKQNVELLLPKFTLSSSFELSNTLAGMGMPDAFTPGVADFSGIDGTTSLFISKVFHKAWGEVNEQGTEAAAATVVVLKGSTVPPTFLFRADHPFIFLIRDTQSGSLLFLGRLANPSPFSTPALMPQLTITRSEKGLSISWPYSSTGWTLQQSADLTNWTPASGSIPNDGTNNVSTITAPARNLFFRLSHVLSPQPLTGK